MFFSDSKSSHDDYDCFAVAFFSHGGKTDTEKEPVECFYAKDECLHLDDLTDWFTPKNCPSLAFKPKLFFIQVSVVLAFSSFLKKSKTNSLMT